MAGRINQSAIYQRIPGQHLAPVLEKKPQSFAILKLPPAPKDPDFARWEGADKETTLFDNAKRAQRMGVAKQFRDASWAKWEVTPFASGTPLETALERIELENSKIKRLIKIKLNFADGCHLLFERTDWGEPDTLLCKEYHTPHGPTNDLLARTLPNPPDRSKHLAFLTDDKGHLRRRRRDPVTGDPLSKSLGSYGRLTLPSVGTAARSLGGAPSSVKSTGMPGEQPGKFGFDFTPVGYNSAAVRPSKYIPGIRPGLRETNRTAFQTLRRDQYNEPAFTGERQLMASLMPQRRNPDAIMSSALARSGNKAARRLRHAAAAAADTDAAPQEPADVYYDDAAAPDYEPEEYEDGQY